MKAEELRIGNLVFEKSTSKIVEVETIGEYGINIDLSNSDLYGPSIDSISFDNITPIPITEAWLERLGFENTDGVDFPVIASCYKSLGDLNICITIIESIFYIQLINGNHVVALGTYDYIHQLQNLYYALTGEELTLKSTES